ncbi:MAG: glycosyltransferase family 39 protein [Chloroflexi bacterium]|nr:glycosyltransferase family 39 protein [Chloroflexota bacterium]
MSAMRSAARAEHVLLALVIVGTLLLRIPSFFEPHWYGDEGVFAAIARQLLDGRRLYEEAWDHKPPLIYVLYAGIMGVFGESMPALRAAVTLAVVATQVCLFAIVRPTFGVARGMVAAGVYGLLMAYPALEGQLALTEVFMVACTAAAMLLALRLGSGHAGLSQTTGWIAAGLLLSAAAGFKPVALLDAAALLTFVLLGGAGSVRRALLLLAGLATPWVLVLAGFAVAGSLPAFLDANVGFQLRYVGDSDRAADWPYFVAAALLLPLCFAIAGRRSVATLIVLWLGFALAGSLVGGLQYAHYLIQACPPLAVASVTVPARVTPRATVRVASAVALSGALYLAVSGSTELLTREAREYGREYYAAFGRAVEQRQLEEFHAYFGGSWHPTREVVAALHRAGAGGHDALVWSNRAWIYPLAGLRPIAPYVVEHHTRGRPDLQERIAEAVRTVPATFIVIEAGRTLPPALQRLVDDRYACEVVPGYTLCRLVEARDEGGGQPVPRVPEV